MAGDLNLQASSAASMSQPNVSDYTIGEVNQGNMFERIGDWFSGYDRVGSMNQRQAMLDKKWELEANKYLDSTRYQRMVEDLKAAGLNPWLAINGGSMSPGNASVAPSSAATIKEKKFKSITDIIKGAKEEQKNKMTTALTLMTFLAKVL